MNILAIETSCDETAAAVVQDGTKIISNVVASSTAMHQKYGGIVPEVAAREQLRCIIPVMEEALQPLMQELKTHDYQTTIKNYIDAIAITIGPGLIGSLLVGVETAKTIAFVTGKPLIPVNHVLAHMYANFVKGNEKHEAVNTKKQGSNLVVQQYNNETIAFPAISLVVSGGHTELYLMQSEKDLTWLGGTVDDAAGEAFDKTARLLGFGNSGGPAIAAAANEFRVQNSEFRITLPRPMMHDKTLNFSFSGLKTAVMREWNKHPTHDDRLVAAFAHEVQEAITDVLVAKTISAATQHGATSILLSGGVAANTRLREKLSAAIQQCSNIAMYVPESRLCTDNAVYIASYAYFRGTPTDWHDITAQPDLSVEE